MCEGFSIWDCVIERVKMVKVLGLDWKKDGDVWDVYVWLNECFVGVLVWFRCVILDMDIVIYYLVNNVRVRNFNRGEIFFFVYLLIKY